MSFRRYESSFVIVILLVAALLRFYDIGAEPFFDDQAKISVQALTLARFGEWEFLGPEMSTGGIRHSPITNYLYAIPFRITADPRIARLFTGMANLLAVPVVYLIGKRFFDHKAGLLAALLYALYPAAVKGSRFIWNQNLAAPFVMLFILSALMGYYEDKKYARIAHLPLLSLAGQCHPTLFLLFPVSLACWIHAWRHHSESRRRLIEQTIFSAVIALLLMLPWIIGITQTFLAIGQIDNITAGSNPGVIPMVEIIFRTLSGVFSVYGDLRPHSPNILHDTPNLTFLAILTIASAIWLTVGASLRTHWFPGLVLVLAFFLVPVLVLVLDIGYWHHHIWPLLGSATLMQGVLLGGTAKHPLYDRQHSRIWNWSGLLNDRVLRWPSLVFFSAICVQMIYLHITYDRTEGVHSLDENIAALNEGLLRARQTGTELILTALNDPDYRCPGCPGWEALHLLQDIPIRVVWDGYSLPLPNQGALLMGVKNYSRFSQYFLGGQVIHGWFRIVELPPAAHFQPDLVGSRPFQFSNGSTVLGFLRESPGSLPTAGQPWTVSMIWRVDAPLSGESKVFAHLLDDSGQVHAQKDPPGLPSDQWRTAEHVMSTIEFAPDELLPSAGPLYIRFGMYGDYGHAEIIDINGEPTGLDGLIQIRGARDSAHEWSHGLTLDAFYTNNPLQQGAPINVTATWHARHGAQEQGQIRWGLIGAHDVLAFEGSTKLYTDSPTSTLPSGAFLTENYSLRIAPDIAPGTYKLRMDLLDPSGTPLGAPFYTPIEIMPRNRHFNHPTLQYKANAVFSNQIKLVGYDLNYGSGYLTLVLHWEALDRMVSDYKYFIHVWQANEVVAQADAMPDDYRYPTSWWAPGEVFSDTIRIDLNQLAPGTAMVTLGLYDPSTMERLTITDGLGNVEEKGSIELGEVLVP